MNEFIRGIKRGFPICLGYIPVSFTFGLIAVKMGFSPLQATLISLTNMASAGQFAGIRLIEGGAPYIELIITTFVINLRYFLMSLSLSQKVDPEMPFYKRAVMAYCITDEIFGLSSAVPGYLEPFYSYAITFISVAGWSGGTVMGVLVGNILPAAAVNALSVSLYGMFLAIIIPPAKQNRFIGGLVAVSMAVSWIFSILPLTKGISSGFKVIILTILLAGAAAALKPIEDDNDSEQED